MAFSVVLYGSDTNYTTSERPLTTTLTTALGAALSNISLSAYGIKARPEYDIEEVEKACGIKENIVKGYVTYNVRILVRNYSSTKYTLAEVFTEFPMLTKKYLWLYASDYGISFKTANQTIAVVFTGMGIEDVGEGAAFFVTLNFKSRAPFGG